MSSLETKAVKILITGSDGFVGKNLQLHLAQREDVDVVCFNRGNRIAELPDLLQGVDFVFHLAGVNRPQDLQEFATANVDLTRALCQAICAVAEASGKKIPIVYTSSIQAGNDTPYGQSKLAAEKELQAASRNFGIPVYLYRLPNVFGKWCKPNYNSVVATFCHNIARNLPIQINDPAARLQLVYVDDVVAALLAVLEAPAFGCVDAKVTPEYKTTLGELAKQISGFGECRTTLVIDRVGAGFLRALYATYVSYLPVARFSYEVPQHADPRGVFVEMLKTQDSGQFSYFTAHPGITRGAHYHHTKTEKFLIVRGEALFRFRNILTDELVELRTSGAKPQVVDTIPGWAHDITNVGDDEMVVMLWSSENFDRDKPDTVVSKVQ